MDVGNVENRPPPEPQEVETQNNEGTAEEQQNKNTQAPVQEDHNIDVFA